MSNGADSGRARRIRWLIIAVVFGATVLNYVDRQTLSVLAPVLQDRLRMNAVEYGRVLAAFMLAYTLGNALWGPLVDRLGVRRGYLLAVLWWSAAEILHVFAKSPLTLGVCRFFLGAGEAGNWPAAVKTVAEWFPPRERSLAAGIFNSGAAIGAVIAPPIVAWLALHYGWRFAFGAVGSAGLLWVLVWIATYPAKSSDPRISENNKAAAAPFALLRSRFIWQFTLAKVFFDPVWYFYTFWFPEYLKLGRGFDLPAIGATVWIPFLAADLGNLAGGFLGGWIVRLGRSPQQGRKRAIALFMLPMMASSLVVIAPGTIAMFAFASIAAFGYTSALSNMLALPGDAFGAEVTASVWGFASVGAGLGGMLFSLITGWIVYKWSFAPAFVLFGCIPLLAAALIISLPESGSIGEAANRI